MMPRGYDSALYILSFDHRGSFQKRKKVTRKAAVGEIARRYHKFVGVFEAVARATATRPQA